MNLNEQIHRMKSFMGIKEEEIALPNDPNLMHFFHGGDLDEIKYDLVQRSDRQVYGPGLYLITSWDVAKKYAKGGRKMYIVSVEKGTDLEDKTIDFETLSEFLKRYLPAKKAQEVLERANYRLHENNIPLFIVSNILINSGYMKSKFSLTWKTFIVGLGVDYQMDKSAFGGAGDMMILYNPMKIKSVKRIMPNDKLPTFDLKDLNP